MARSIPPCAACAAISSSVSFGMRRSYGASCSGTSLKSPMLFCQSGGATPIYTPLQKKKTVRPAPSTMINPLTRRWSIRCAPWAAA